jgi:hypothetical protein
LNARVYVFPVSSTRTPLAFDPSPSVSPCKFRVEMAVVSNSSV